MKFSLRRKKRSSTMKRAKTCETTKQGYLHLKRKRIKVFKFWRISKTKKTKWMKKCKEYKKKLNLRRKTNQSRNHPSLISIWKMTCSLEILLAALSICPILMLAPLKKVFPSFKKIKWLSNIRNKNLTHKKNTRRIHMCYILCWFMQEEHMVVITLLTYGMGIVGLNLMITQWQR